MEILRDGFVVVFILLILANIFNTIWMDGEPIIPGEDHVNSEIEGKK